MCFDDRSDLGRLCVGKVGEVHVYDGAVLVLYLMVLYLRLSNVWCLCPWQNVPFCRAYWAVKGNSDLQHSTVTFSSVRQGFNLCFTRTEKLLGRVLLVLTCRLRSLAYPELPREGRFVLYFSL